MVLAGGCGSGVRQRWTFHCRPVEYPTKDGLMKWSRTPEMSRKTKCHCVQWQAKIQDGHMRTVYGGSQARGVDSEVFAIKSKL